MIYQTCPILLPDPLQFYRYQNNGFADVQYTIVDGGLRRNYLKGLGFSCSAEFLAILSASLRTEQVVRLYLDIRNSQPEREPEFRDDFLRGFARHSSALPPP